MSGPQAATAQAPPPRIPIPPPPAIAAAPAPTPIPTPEQERSLATILHDDSDRGYFVDCDGYGAYSTIVDNMYERTTPFFGEPHGIAACDAALMDVEGRPEFWMRKVSVLEGRALNRLVVNDAAGALRDLDLADAAAVDKTDLYYQHSLKISIDLVRAYALQVSGDSAHAEALAMQTWEKRPYSRGVSYATLLALGPSARAEDATRVLRSTAGYFPAAANDLFNTAFEHGRFEDAVSLYPAVAPVAKLGDMPMEMRAAALLAQTNRAEAEKFWAIQTSRYAYALAALGRTAEARAALKAAKDRYASSTPDAPQPGQGASVRELTEYAVHQQANLQIKNDVPPVLDVWSQTVEARCAVNEGKAAETWSAILATHAKLIPSWASVDLIHAIAAQVPTLAPFAATITQQLERQRQLSRRAEITRLFQSLPEAETRERLAGYRKEGSWLGGLRVSEKNGFTVYTDGAKGVTTITFRGPRASFAIVQDMALLKAVDMARTQGKKGVIVLASRDIRHTLTTYTYGRAGPPRFDGYETQIDVMFVDPANPPPAYRSAPWRIVDADAVYTALAPFYIAPDGAPGR